MLVDNSELLLGSELINFEMHKGTQAERLALQNLTGGEFFYETDTNIGVWIYSNGSWVKPGLGRLITITGDGYVGGRHRDNATGTNDFVMTLATFDEDTGYGANLVYLSDALINGTDIPSITSVYHNQLTSLVYSGSTFHNGDGCGIMITNNDAQISMNPGTDVSVVGLSGYNFNTTLTVVPSEPGNEITENVTNTINSIGATVEAATTTTYNVTIIRTLGQY